MVDTVDNAFSVVSQVLNKVVENYSKILNTPVTLYTPNTNFRHYCIQKKSNGKYRVVWIPEGYIQIVNLNLTFGWCSGLGTRSNEINPSGYSGYVNTNISTTTIDGGYGYYSSDMDTIDDCINAIKSKNTTYTFLTSSNRFSYVNDNNFKIPVSNTLIIYRETSASKTQCFASQQISANETIEVI